MLVLLLLLHSHSNTDSSRTDDESQRVKFDNFLLVELSNSPLTGLQWFDSKTRLEG